MTSLSDNQQVSEVQPSNTQFRTQVDELITAVPGEWRFDGQVAQHFDSHVRKSVPFYDQYQEMAVEISEWFVRDGATVYDLGSATGQTIALLYDKHQTKKNLRFVGIDNSYPMIEQARARCQRDDVNFLYQDISDVREFNDAGLVISIYTLQFLTINERRRVLSRIYRDLQEGGALILCEKVRGETALFEDIWLELHWDMKLKAGFNYEQVFGKARSLRGIMIPQTLSENIQMLRDVGFTHVDVFTKVYNFAGLVAVKMGRGGPPKGDADETGASRSGGQV